MLLSSENADPSHTPLTLTGKRYREVMASARDRHKRCRLSSPAWALELQLPRGLLVSTIQLLMSPYDNILYHHENTELLDLLKKVAHVNQEWREMAESLPIIGQTKCFIVDTSLPQLIDSKLNVRHLVLDKIFDYTPYSEEPEVRMRQQELEDTTLRAVSGIAALVHLTLRSFTRLDLSLLGGLENLRSLSIEFYQHSLPGVLLPLAALTLTNITLDGIDDIDCNVFAEQAQTLTSLTISRYGTLANVASLTQLIWLERLTLSHMTHISFLAQMPSLTHLDLYQSFNLTDLTPLSGLVDLNTLNLHFCDNLVDLWPLKTLTSLETLDLGGMYQLTDLSPLIPLTRLRSLRLDGCIELSDTSSLTHLPSLTVLDLTQCRRIPQLDFLSTAVKLEDLRLDSCVSLTSISPIRSCCNLRRLSMSHCIGVTDLSPLTSCQALTRFSVYPDTKITERLDIDNMASLYWINNTRVQR